MSDIPVQITEIPISIEIIESPIPIIMSGDSITVSITQDSAIVEIIQSDVSVAVSGGEITVGLNEETIDVSVRESETDPIFRASPSYSISSSDITNLSNLSGTNTGDQDLSPYLTDAPIDGSTYGRNNGLWAIVTGLTNHALLSNLDYANAGHTGFQAALVADTDYLTPQTALTTYLRKINDPDLPDMGYEQGSSSDGITADYITDKRLSNILIGGNARTENGGIRIDVAEDPDTYEIYLRGVWQTIIYDLTTEHGDFRHTPLSEQIYVWRGSSVANGLNGRPIINEYKASMGAFPTPRVVSGGTF